MHEVLPQHIGDTAASRVHVLVRDIETRSTADLKKVGAYKYATDPSTQVLCVAHAADNDPVQLWIPGDPIPKEFIEAAADPNWIVVAHNDFFESQIEQHILAPRFAWPLIPIERHRCTMAAALAAALPGRLDAVANALELANRKDAAGARLMHQTSKPRRARKDEDPTSTYWFDDQERLDRLHDYCKQDTETERELYARLPPLTPAEQTLWILDRKINERGYYVHRQFAEAACKIAQAAAPELDQELAEITGGAVTTIGQVTKLRAWLAEQGCPTKKLDKKAIEQLLRDPDLLPPHVLRALELRQGGAQAAANKFNAVLAHAGADDRVRGSYKYHGASTGRWAGSGFQPQNLKRPVVEDLDAAVAAVATGDYQHVNRLYPGKVLSVVGDCARNLIVAAPGHVLIGADFSSIESRVLAWAAGEEWKLDAYRHYDATQNREDEPYFVTARKINPGNPDRSIGKTCDLAFGYLGSVGAWRKFEPDKFSDQEVETFKAGWRAAHPKTVEFWRSINNAAIDAVLARGRVFRCGLVTFKTDGASLLQKLPSGRKLSYPQPRIVIDAKYNRPAVVFADNGEGQFKDCRGGRGAFGGTWTENAVSGIARDLLAEAMLRIEAAGYSITLHTHDEIVAEVPVGFGSEEEFRKLMTRVPSWALGLPIAAKAWSGARYAK